MAIADIDKDDRRADYRREICCCARRKLVPTGKQRVPRRPEVCCRHGKFVPCSLLPARPIRPSSGLPWLAPTPLTPMADDAQPLFLGLDLSTQQLKAILIDEDSVVVHEAAVGFDRDLPHYNTTNGAVRGPDDGEVTSPVAMWLEAIDLLLERMRDAGIDLSSIRAVSGAGQVRAFSRPVLICAPPVLTARASAARL
jgi:hypothetical protein